MEFEPLTEDEFDARFTLIPTATMAMLKSDR
jgi:hypothetical protein